MASGNPDSFSGEFLVPSYRGSSFLDPKGRGGSTVYDNAVALPVGGRLDAIVIYTCTSLFLPWFPEFTLAQSHIIFYILYV